MYKTLTAIVVACSVLAHGAVADEVTLPGIKVGDDNVDVGGTIRVSPDEVIVGPIRVDRDRTSTKSKRSSKRVVHGEEFTNTDFSGMDLRGRSFIGAEIVNVEFHNANLEYVDFSGARLSNVEFHGANLRGACFLEADFTNVEFDGADMTDAVLVGAVESNTDYGGAITRGVIWNGAHGCGQIYGGARPEVTTAAVIEEALLSGDEIDLTINFEFDSDRIQGRGHEQILEIARALQSAALAGQRILVEGHTDADGADGYNMDLSYRRAVTVVRALDRQYEVDSVRLEVQGYGEGRPVATNDTTEGKALNRRVTLVNLGPM